MGEDGNSAVCWCEALGAAGLKKLGGDDFKRHFTARRGEIHRCGVHVAYGPTLAWASSNAKISWRQRAGAMGGGTDASLQWRRIRVITASWVIAAMIRSEPRRHKGRSQGSLRPHSGGRHVAISRSKTRPSSLAQCQYGVPVFVSSPSRPCGAMRPAAFHWRAARSPPAEVTG